MKRNYIIFTCLLLTAFIYSCDKNTITQIDSPVLDGGQVKFFHFGVAAPSVNFYANTAKVSATLSATGAESATGVAVGGVFPANNYSLLAAGQYTFKGQIPSTVATDPNLAIASLAATIEKDKYYSFYTSGIYNTTAKTTDAFMIEDLVPAIDSTTSYVRFVNAISNAPSTVNLVIKNTNTLVETTVATGLAYKSGSVFVKIPNGVYDLYFRYSTAPTVNVFTRTAVAFSRGRVYTVASRGDMTVSPAGTLANRPQLDNTANR